MSKTRIPATKNAPNKVHQRRFVSLQLRLRPPIAFVSSIMIAGAYRLIAIVTYRATMPPMTKPISDPQIATMAAELEGPPNEIEGIRTSNGSKTRPKVRSPSNRAAPKMLGNFSNPRRRARSSDIFSPRCRRTAYSVIPPTTMLLMMIPSMTARRANRIKFQRLTDGSTAEGTPGRTPAPISNVPRRA